jgi:hypothetical protein
MMVMAQFFFILWVFLGLVPFTSTSPEVATLVLALEPKNGGHLKKVLSNAKVDLGLRSLLQSTNSARDCRQHSFFLKSDTSDIRM